MDGPPDRLQKLQAVLGTVITDVQGLRVDEGSGDTTELSSLRSGQLLAARNGQREEPAHVIDESPGMGGERDLDRVGNLTESVSFEKLVLAVHVFAKRLRVTHFDVPPEGGPTLAKIGKRAGHLEVVDRDDQNETEFRVKEAARPILNWPPAALSGGPVELLLPVPARVRMAVKGQDQAANGVG